MKKKSVRKISGLKKVSSKSPNKKTKFSLKAWLLGGVVILIALAYSYSNSQPKSYKVIELSGKAEDYIKPAPVDINLINNTIKGPISDTPEANAIAAAAQAKKIAKEAGKSDEQANQAAKIAANQAVKQTYQANAAAGVMTNADAQKALTVKEKSADGTEKTEAEKAAEYATNYVQNNINIVPKTDETTGTTSYSIQIQPNYGSQVNTEGQCETSNGGSVYAGSTVIGSSDRVYRCTSTGWQATDTYCVASKMDIKDCPVSVKPSYALPTGKANCYSGSVIIGQDQVVDTKDGKRVCDNGALIQPKKINGQIVTPDEYEEILKDQQNKCVNNGGSWTQTGGNTGEYYCGKGNSKSCSDIGKIFSEATQGCVEPGSAGDKADSKKTTPYSKAGCDNARDKNKEDCIQSADNPLLWVIVPKGTKPSLNSGVPAKVSSEVNSNKISNTYTGKECEDAAKNNPGYTCEPIAGGNYYKLTPISQLPAPQREYVTDAQGNFGSTSQGNSSSQQETLEEYAGQNAYKDCMQKAASLGDDVSCNVSGTDGTYESYELVRETPLQPVESSTNEPTTYNNYYQLWSKPAKSYCYFSFQCSGDLSCSDRKCGGESGTTKVANSSSQTTTTQEETIKEYSGQYAYRDCMAAANSMGNDVGCNVSGTDGTYESYNLVKQVIVPANQTNTSANNNLKKPGESCNALGFLWFGSDDQCNSGICGRRESGDISGKAGNYCANESGNIPSAKVDYPEKSLSECKETLPSDQECVRNPETGYFYRSYK